MLSYATASTVVNWLLPIAFFSLSLVDDYFDDNVIRKWSVNDIMKAVAAAATATTFNDEKKNNPFVFTANDCFKLHSWYLLLFIRLYIHRYRVFAAVCLRRIRLAYMVRTRPIFRQIPSFCPCCNGTLDFRTQIIRKNNLPNSWLSGLPTFWLVICLHESNRDNFKLRNKRGTNQFRIIDNFIIWELEKIQSKRELIVQQTHMFRITYSKVKTCFNQINSIRHCEQKGTKHPEKEHPVCVCVSLFFGTKSTLDD